MAEWILLTEEQRHWLRIWIQNELLDGELAYYYASQLNNVFIQVADQDHMTFALNRKRIGIDQQELTNRAMCSKCHMLDAEVKRYKGTLLCPLHAPLDRDEMKIEHLKSAALKLLSMVDVAEFTLTEEFKAMGFEEDMNFVKYALNNLNLLKPPEPKE